ncbi:MULTISPECIES: phage tail tube protein [unclassified Exiguobacterium]|uniref:phage tail tube protein n=1 Tax=unclassified Exiguobacterium TaxID=2644629 RepID=UPI001BE5A204|nr:MULTISPECIES: phage tail tube protein [unclassified Exiguobacterium]
MSEPINGLFGKLFDEAGEQVQLTQEFESNLEYEKESYTVPGKFLKSHKVLNGEGSGSFTILKADSRLQRKIAENPFAKYNYIGRLKEPGPGGEEAILYTGVSFDGTALLTYNVEEMVEADFDFTFDDYRYISSMA